MKTNIQQKNILIVKERLVQILHIQRLFYTFCMEENEQDHQLLNVIVPNQPVSKGKEAPYHIYMDLS